MTIPAFDWAESDNITLDETPRVGTTQFGDGYEQRSPDGINTIAQQWDLNFDEVDNAIATDIVEYLRARNGVEAFDWTPMWATTPIKVVCPNWKRSVDGPGTSHITARFIQKFEP